MEGANYWGMIRSFGRRPVIYCYVPHRVFAFVTEEKVVDLSFISFVRVKKRFSFQQYVLVISFPFAKGGIYIAEEQHSMSNTESVKTFSIWSTGLPLNIHIQIP